MDGFKKITGKKARLLDIRDGVHRQLRAAIITRHRGRASKMIADTSLAALNPQGPRVTELTVRFVRQQADGVEQEARGTTRLLFLRRQLRRIEEKLVEEDRT